eukprot:2048806-Pyramimonas_sp.AAC.1
MAGEGTRIDKCVECVEQTFGQRRVNKHACAKSQFVAPNSRTTTSHMTIMNTSSSREPPDTRANGRVARGGCHEPLNEPLTYLLI